MIAKAKAKMTEALNQSNKKKEEKAVPAPAVVEKNTTQEKPPEKTENSTEGNRTLNDT